MVLRRTFDRAGASWRVDNAWSVRLPDNDRMGIGATSPSPGLGIRLFGREQ
jgi:hypothetical protein